MREKKSGITALVPCGKLNYTTLDAAVSNVVIGVIF
jgi:hypothetical protein